MASIRPDARVVEAAAVSSVVTWWRAFARQRRPVRPPWPCALSSVSTAASGGMRRSTTQHLLTTSSSSHSLVRPDTRCDTRTGKSSSARRIPVIYGVWDYLIHVPAKEILAIPDLEPGQTVADLPISQEARWLVGFWLNRGASRPRTGPSAWMRDGIRPGSFWGERVRQTIASQVDRIRHWQVYNCSYEDRAVLGRGDVVRRSAVPEAGSGTITTALMASTSRRLGRGASPALAKSSSARTKAQTGCLSDRSPT